MKVSIITLATVLALSSAAAMAHTSRVVANGAQSHHRYFRHVARNGYWSASRLNGHGINRLGITTNSGRKYNGA
jgi:hypothetical protein